MPRLLALAALGGIAYVLATWPVIWAGALVVTAGITLLVLVRPAWGLYVLPLLIPFGRLREISLGPARVGGLEALLGLILAAWLARGVARRELRVYPPPLLAVWTLWLGAMLVSVLGALSLGSSLKELVKWGEMAALYAMAWHELERRDILIITLSMIAAGALAAIQGIYQAVFQVGPVGFLFPLAGRLWLRAYGTFMQPNPYGGYLGLTLPLAYGVVLAGVLPLAKGPRLGGEWPALLLGGVVAVAGGLMGVALVFTLSRGAWLGAAAALVTVSAVLSKRALMASAIVASAGALVLALGGVRALPATLQERLTDVLPYVGLLDIRAVEITDRNFAVIERLAHWYAAVGMFADHPWLGVGVGNYAAVYPAYKLPPWDDPLGHAHNIFLNVAAETGLVGLLAYVLFWLAAFRLTWLAVRTTDGVWRGIAVGALGSFVHLSVHNLVDNLYVAGMYVQVALLLAFVALLTKEPHRAESSPEPNGDGKERSPCLANT
ncbi:MAG: O-antigen ligase family protein [Ardenticatenia bacterium]|nr:O-antigen ligase family protein [Ardenticatenia bacterium]